MENLNPSDPKNTAGSDATAELLARIRSLEIEVHEREKTISLLMNELETLRAYQKDIVHDSLSSQQENLYQEVALPAAQWLTQAYLVEQKGVSVQVKDILAVARRLVRALQNHGLTFIENPGVKVPFDPDRHIPLDASIGYDTGESVVVRFAGVAYHDRLLARASVERSGDLA